MLGDFEVLFPWDLLDKFDLLSIATNQHEALYLHGQLSAFRMSTMVKHWRNLPYFETPARFLELSFGVMADELYWGIPFLKDDTMAPYFNW